jgi:outer membrane protein assembly factor BamB
MQSRRHLVLAGCAVALGGLLAGSLSSLAAASSGPPPYSTTPVAPVLTNPPPPASWDAGNYQEDAQHDGVAPGPALDPKRLHLLWTKGFSGPVSYPVIGGGLVFVDEAINNTPAFYVNAFDGRTGRLVWKSKAINGNGFTFSSMVYADGRLFFIGMTNGVVAFDGATGRIVWNFVQNPIDCNEAWGVSTVAAHKVWVPYTCHDFIGGFDVTTGNRDSGAAAGDTQDGGAAVTADSVYTLSTCHQVFRTSLAGQLVWSRDDGCHGAPAAVTVVHGNQVWARDTSVWSSNGLVLSTANGRVIGHFAGNATPPAFDGNRAITGVAPVPGTGATGGLLALDTTTFRPLWRQSGDGHLSTAPVVSGHIAYVGSSAGRIYGYSTATGAQVWQGGTGFEIGGGDGVFGISDMNIGDGLLAAPAGNHVVVFGS